VFVIIKGKNKLSPEVMLKVQIGPSKHFAYLRTQYDPSAKRSCVRNPFQRTTTNLAISDHNVTLILHKKWRGR